MSLPSQSRISFARINENVRFTGGNLGINTTNPTSTLDVSGTARITTSITSGAVYATNSTITNSVATNVSSGTLNLSTGITSASAQITNSNVTTQTIGTAIVTTNLLAIGNSNTVGNIFTTGGNVGIGTNIPAAKLSIVGSAYDGVGTIRLYPSTYNSRVVMGFMSGESTGSYWTMGKQDGFNFGIALSTNLASGISFSETNISCGPLTTTSLTTGSILATTSISSGVLNATNSTVTNVVATNVSSGTLNLTTGLTAGSAQITNSNVTTETIGTARITTSLLAIGNSNTVGNIFTTGGNVGIGTSSPSYKLDVRDGTINSNKPFLNLANNAGGAGNQVGINLQPYDVRTGGPSSQIISIDDSNASAHLTFWTAPTGTSSGSLERMRIQNGGNVGIGTTSPNYKLHVIGDINYTGSLYQNGSLFSGSSQWLNSGSNIYFSTGNVGIGTTSPSAKLHVQGDTLGGIYNTTSVTNGNILLTNNIGGGVIQFQDINHSIWGRKGYDNQTDVLQIREFDQIQFWTGGLIQNQSIRMLIGSTGNVGIGTVTPVSPLHVAGNVIGTNGTVLITGSDERGHSLYIASSSASHKRLVFNHSGTIGNIFAFDYVNGPQNLILQSPGGNVGIGTTSPSAKLHVSGDTDIFGNLRIGDSGSPNFRINLGTSGVGSYRSAYVYGDGTTIYLTNQQNGGFNFGTNNTWDRLVITAAGNIGIGKSSPSYKLQSTGVISVHNNGEARYHLYNEGGIAEWLFGQKSNTNHNFTFTRKVGPTETDYLSISGWNGRLTIGGADGSYPLTVFGSSNSGSVAGYAGWYNAYNWQVQTTSYDVSIYGQNFMMAGQGFLSVSDQRIKKDIVDIEDGESLNILRQIQPKRYRYIDEYKRGTDYVYGFIAQQVRGVLPAASNIVKDVIPSIITPATVSYDSVNNITTVTLVDNKQHNLTSENSNSRVRFFDENDTNTDLELHEIVSGNIFKVKGELKGANTFVYGIEVEDFHTLNKDAIFTVAFSALQEVDRQLQETRTELQETKQTVNDLVQRIQALENAN